jgi:Tfp pilus assembly protein PilO
MKLGDPIKLPSGVASLLNLHIAGVALLAILNVVLLAKLGIAFRDLGSSRQDQLQAAQMQLTQLEVADKRLRDLPAKVELSRKDADKFYAARIPANYSSILADLGELATKDSIRLTRAGYSQAPAIEGLVELRIDANLAGDYGGVMSFINGLERDKTLYVINALTLTGQQEGKVNLRLRLTTYLHAKDATDLPPSSGAEGSPEGDQPSAPGGPVASLPARSAPEQVARLGVGSAEGVR